MLKSAADGSSPAVPVFGDGSGGGQQVVLLVAQLLGAQARRPADPISLPGPTLSCCPHSAQNQQSPVAQQLVAGVSAATVALMASPLPAMAEVTPSLRCAQGAINA
jgi:hypothetical protein